ncbi:hypothetical protein [Alienimonas californiensis]|uniref:hypothetical protein n=1 Tax=Alienimonas californiensis TaxID=2527989 RepID=UPI0011A4FD43|nr:hypothetical protein [Alienimonas californiensis]
MIAALAALGGCEGNATVATPPDSRPAPSHHAAAPPPSAAPVAPAAPAPAVREATPRRSDPRPPVLQSTVPRREERAAERRGVASPPRGGSGMTAVPGVTTVPGTDPFDPEIDPSTLSRPEPIAPAAAEPPPERIDVPLTAAIPPDKQAIPDDLALPVGAVLYYQDGRDWIEVELKMPAPPATEGGEAATELRVHRTDRPAIIPDVRVRRDQLVVTKLLVRRLEAAR